MEVGRRSGRTGFRQMRRIPPAPRGLRRRTRIRSVMGMVELTLPRSFFAMATGGVFPLSATNWFSSTLLTMRGFDTVFCARTDAPATDVKARKWKTNLCRGRITTNRKPFSGKLPDGRIAVVLNRRSPNAACSDRMEATYPVPDIPYVKLRVILSERPQTLI